MTFKTIEYMLAILEEGGFSRAAARAESGDSEGRGRNWNAAVCAGYAVDPSDGGRGTACA